ncbi:hypothetical protein [Nostoc sp. C052]|uniref:DUF6887 family protein n=2 Tax=Nostoc sp. C052 TaxID=2576902 RepID=UPI003562656B
MEVCMSNQINFIQMTRTELRRYILDNRNDEKALEIYLDRFRNPNNQLHQAPESIDDLENYGELHQQYLEQRRASD